MNYRAGAFACAFLLLTACGGEEGARQIRAAVTPASPPNLFEQDGETVGLDLDLFRAFADARGYTLEITAYDWQGMLGAVVGGQADVAFSGISITEPRKEVMDFSDPYMDNTWNLMSLSARNIEIGDLAQLSNYVIGYPRGMAYSDFIKNELEPKGYYQLDKVKLYPSYNEALTDLQNGNLDFVFIDGTVASVYRKQLPVRDSYVFSGFDTFGYAFPKGSTIRDEFNAFMRENDAQRQAIIDKWMN